MESKNYVKSMILFILIIGIIFAIFYGITVLLTNKKEKSSTEETITTNIDSDQIMIGNMYNLTDTEYYILVEMPNDDKLSTYEASRSEYLSNDDSIKIYIADLSSAFNKKYISDASEFNIGTNNFPKFSKTTLLKINNNVLEEVYEGEEEITNKFSEINEA